MGTGRVLPKTGFYLQQLDRRDSRHYLWVVDSGDTLGSVLRRLRENSGLSREELATAASISAEYVGQLERDKKKPSIQAIWELTKALGVDAYRTAELFELAELGEFWKAVSDAASIVRKGVPSIDAFVDNTPELRSPEARVTARTVLKALSRNESATDDEQVIEEEAR